MLLILINGNNKYAGFSNQYSRIRFIPEENAIISPLFYKYTRLPFIKMIPVLLIFKKDVALGNMATLNYCNMAIYLKMIFIVF
jgi:hypothetical protein